MEVCCQVTHLTHVIKLFTTPMTIMMSMSIMTMTTTTMIGGDGGGDDGGGGGGGGDDYDDCIIHSPQKGMLNLENTQE